MRPTPHDLAGRHFPHFKEYNGEIIPMYCPFCEGGQNGDKHTFAMNAITGAYNCKRGTCAVEGSFKQLCEYFGERTEPQRNYETRRKPERKAYISPKTKAEPPDDQVADYLKKRGFSPKTWQHRKVGGDSKGNIVMPYYENGKLVLVKFRPAHKPKKGEKKGWREEGGKPVFWGMDECDPRFPLVIVEGEMDALALDECEIPNVVSLPSGAEDLTCVDVCWDWLQKFRYFVIWTDNDDAGIRCRDKLIKRLGPGRCAVVVSDRKDANEVLYHDGTQAVIDAVKNAQNVPMAGLTSLASLPDYDPGKDTVISSGMSGIDSVMGGGFRTGEVTVWTGINSSGKSTLLGQVLLSTVNEGYKVCAYSGELPGQIFRYWIDLQAAGPAYVYDQWREERKATVIQVKFEAVKAIREWYKDYFYLYDSNGAAAEDALLEVFEYAVQRYDCRVFMVDNLMTTVLGSESERDFYRKQSEFIGRMVEFAHNYDVHVHVVAHPRKVQAGKRLTKMDVSGSGDITNRADNVFCVHRLTRKELEKEEYYGCSTVVEVWKNRANGKQDIEIKLGFECNSRRFYMAKTGDSKWDYNWVELLGKTPIKQEAEITEDPEDSWAEFGREVSSSLF